MTSTTVLCGVCMKLELYIPLLAGSLLLAHDGVCVIENLSSLKKDVRKIPNKGM